MNFDLGSSVRSLSLRASAARSRQNFGPPIVIGFLGELRPLMQRWPELHVPGRSLSEGGRWRTGLATRSLAPSADDALLEAAALSSRRQSSPCLPLALMTRVRRPAEGGTQHRTGAWSQGGEHHPCARCCNAGPRCTFAPCPGGRWSTGNRELSVAGRRRGRRSSNLRHGILGRSYTWSGRHPMCWRSERRVQPARRRSAHAGAHT